MSRGVSKCKAALADLRKVHSTKEPLTTETAKQLDALVQSLRDDGVTSAFVKEGGIAVIESVMREPQRYPSPAAATTACCKVMLQSPPGLISSAFVTDLLLAVKSNTDLYPSLLDVLHTALTRGHAPEIACVAGLPLMLVKVHHHSTSLAPRALQCMTAVVTHKPEAGAVLRREKIVQTLMSSNALLSEEMVLSAAPLLGQMLDAATAEALYKGKGVRALIDMLSRPPAHQVAVLKALTKFLQVYDTSKSELDQGTLASLVDFVSLEGKDSRVLAETVKVLQVLLSQEKRLVRLLHLKAVGSGKDIVQPLMQPLISSSDASTREFGCRIMRKVAELRFRCEKCSTVITDTRRYCSLSRTSFCQGCYRAVKEGYVLENADFRWSLVALLKPALDALLREVNAAEADQSQVERICQKGANVDNLMAMFDTMSECVGEMMFTGIPGDIVQVALNLVQRLAKGGKKSTVMRHSLAVLSRAAATSEYSSKVATAVVKLFIKSIDDFDEEQALSVLSACIMHANPLDIKESLISILPKAYSLSVKVKEQVAHTVKAGLLGLPDDLVGDVVREGLTGSLMEILRSKAQPEAKDACIASFSRSLHHEHRSDFLSSPQLLEAAIKVFQLSKDKSAVAAPMAALMRHLCGTGRRDPATPTNRSRQMPPRGQGHEVHSNPETPLSARSHHGGQSFLSGSGSPGAKDPRSPSEAVLVTSHTGSSFLSNSSGKTAPLLDSSASPAGMKEKAAVLFCDEGFEVLFHFTQCNDSVKDDALVALAGLVPCLSAAMHKEHVRCLLNIVVELTCTKKNGALSSCIFLTIAAEESLRKHFTAQALTVVIELAGSQVRETQENAVHTLRFLNEGTLTLNTEASVHLWCQYKGKKERFSLAGKATLEKVKKHFTELFPRTPIAAGRMRVRIGAREILDDSELVTQLAHGANVVVIEEEASGVQATPRRTSKASKRKWKLGRELGSGAFGTVHHVVDEETAQQYAAKVFKLKQRGDAQQKMQESFMNEIELLRTLDHENIVRYIDTQRKGDMGYIILEYVPGGSLLDFRRKFNTIHERVAAKFIKHALCGLDYLHQHNVIHLDVKSANLLVNTSGVVKVADFGCGARFEVDGEQTTADGRTTGTLPFMAPEVITERRFSTACDIWSLGCTVIEMVCGGLVWCPKCKDPFEFVHKIRQEWRQGLTPLHHLERSQVSDACRHFLQRCLIIEPQKRASAMQLMRDPWVSERFELAEMSNGSILRGEDMLMMTVNDFFDTVPPATGTYVTSAPPTMMPPPSTVLPSKRSFSATPRAAAAGQGGAGASKSAGSNNHSSNNNSSSGNNSNPNPPNTARGTGGRSQSVSTGRQASRSVGGARNNTASSAAKVKPKTTTLKKKQSLRNQKRSRSPPAAGEWKDGTDETWNQGT